MQNFYLPSDHVSYCHATDTVILNKHLVSAKTIYKGKTNLDWTFDDLPLKTIFSFATFDRKDLFIKVSETAYITANNAVKPRKGYTHGKTFVTLHN